MLITEMVLLVIILATAFAHLDGFKVGPGVDYLPYPSEFLECLRRFGRQVRIQERPGEEISSFCISQYLWVARTDRWVPTRDVPRFQFLADLAVKNDSIEIAESAMVGPGGARLFAGPQLRVRKEYRKMTGRERRRYHRALNQMKKDKSMHPNVYDFFANIHTGISSLRSAHGGPNFLGWHRIYLYLFENALREKIPDVTLPYWDCSLDFPLSRPGDSVVFGKGFAGNGDGAVTIGPFRRWGLVRNVGAAGRLVSKANIESLLTANSHADIALPTSPIQTNLEFYHNGIHVFVGGLVSSLNTAARDPLFFMLHCFIDYIWWLFRNKIKEAGTDPSQDYPANIISGHHPNDTMYNFPDYQVIAGYDNNWTDTVYTYEGSPNCPCRSKWLTCVQNQCVTKVRKETLKTEPEPVPEVQSSMRRFSFRGGVDSDIVTESPTSTVSPGVTESPVSVELDLTCEKMTCPNDQNTVQNTFVLGNESDSRKWVYFPLKIVHIRRSENVYRSFEKHDDNFKFSNDIFSASRSRTLESDLKSGSLGTYPNCKTSGSGAQKVFITADGVSYDGHSLEYGIVDDRLPVSTAYVYLPIKDPSNGCSTVILASYDECGRLCRPLCKTGRNKHCQVRNYTPCSGLVKVSEEGQFYDPYGSSVAEAILKIWHFPSRSELGDRSPFDEDQNIQVVFVCDSVEQYPWDRV